MDHKKYNFNIRYANYKDIESITDIYNYSVRHEVATFEEVEITADVMKSRFNEVVLNGHPFIVVTTTKNQYDERSDDAAAASQNNEIVVGYCYLLRYKPRSGYRYTCTDSIYIHHDYRGVGVGSLLLERIIQISKDMGYYTMIGVTSGGNDVSVKLHLKFGFKYRFSLENVGLKFGLWINTDYFQLTLNPSKEVPTNPIKLIEYNNLI